MNPRSRGWLALAVIAAILAGAALQLASRSGLLNPPGPEAGAAPGPRRALEEAAAHERSAVELLRLAEEGSQEELYLRAGFAAQRALALDPERLAASEVELRVLQSQHRFADLLTASTKLSAKFPHHAAFIGLAGDAQLELGHYAEAGQSYQRMVELKPGSASYERVGYFRLLHGDLDGAIVAYQLTIAATAPSHRYATASAMTYLAQAKLGKGDLTAAAAWLERALTVLPSYAPAHETLGYLSRLQGKTGEALRAYRAAMACSRLPRYRLSYADALQDGGDTAAAAEHYALAERESGSDQRLLAELLLRQNKELPRAEALARAEHALRQDVFTEDVLTAALLANGKASEAAASSERACRLGTRDSRISLHAGLLAASQGDHRSARGLLESALRLYPPLTRTERAQAEAALGSSGAGKVSSAHR